MNSTQPILVRLKIANYIRDIPEGGIPFDGWDGITDGEPIIGAGPGI